MKVDKFGNIIGGVNPFEGTDIKLEDQPKVGDDGEVGAIPLLPRSSSLMKNRFVLLTVTSCRVKKEGLVAETYLLVFPALSY